MKTCNRVYLPDVVGGGYRDFWRFKGRYRVVKGSRASKKSKTTALNLIVRMMQYPGANTLVIRKVFRTLKDSCFTELKWAIGRLGVERWWEVKESPLEMTYRPTGQKIYFRGLDDPLKITSITVENGYLCWAWVEEAYEIGKESDFDMLDESIRGALPAESKLFKQITITFNPWNENHWLKSRFFDTPSPDVLAITTNYTCNEWLDEADEKVFEAMKRNNPRRYQVAGLGEWGVSEGLIFERWEEQDFDPAKIGILEKDGKEINEQWKYRHVFGLDYGYTNDPTAFIAAAVNPVDKVLYIYDEIYETRLLNSDIAERIQRKGYAKERIYADCAEPKSNEDLRRLGLSRITPSVKGKDSVLNGISVLQDYRMMVHPKCKNTIMELSSYCWDQNGSGESINKPMDENNHLMDALRYAMADVLYFAPTEPSAKKRSVRPIISGSDVAGNWDY